MSPDHWFAIQPIDAARNPRRCGRACQWSMEVARRWPLRADADKKHRSAGTGRLPRASATSDVSPRACKVTVATSPTKRPSSTGLADAAAASRTERLRHVAGLRFCSSGRPSTSWRDAQVEATDQQPAISDQGEPREALTDSFWNMAAIMSNRPGEGRHGRDAHRQGVRRLLHRHGVRGCCTTRRGYVMETRAFNAADFTARQGVRCGPTSPMQMIQRNFNASRWLKSRSPAAEA